MGNRASSGQKELPPADAAQQYFNYSGGCPVLPPQPTPSTSAPSTQPDSCPARYKNPNVYNVYGQRVNDPSAPIPASPLRSIQGADILDPKNNMPLEANQLPYPGQRKPLSTDRVSSSIPKGGTFGTWQYPSPQMVFNALKRKGKGDDIDENDMDGFIAAHNSLNEATWRHVAVWEKLHPECDSPTLLRFKGRPDALSPLARLRMLLGGPEPFDRHDWTVDRCGQEVRYVIDFYYDEAKAGTAEAFEVVARPALDSFDSALDRLKMNIYIKFAEWGLPCPITRQAGAIGQEAASVGAGGQSQQAS